MADKVFTLRIDEDLLNKVKISADKHKRSIAKEIEFILEAHLCNDITQGIQDLAELIMVKYPNGIKIDKSKINLD